MAKDIIPCAISKACVMPFRVHIIGALPGGDMDVCPMHARMLAVPTAATSGAFELAGSRSTDAFSAHGRAGRYREHWATFHGIVTRD